MKCYQCDKPAMYMIGDENVPLCLNCYSTWSHIQNMQFLQNAAMVNHALDEIDMVTGFRSMEGRLPVQEIARAMQKGHTLNNFNISQSQIGVLNTGSIERIDAAITLSRGSDTELIGEALKDLTAAVISSEELNQEDKNDVLDLTETLADEVVGKRKPATINAVMKEITKKVMGAATLVRAAEKLRDVLETLLGG
ncbi:MAG: hypothetical protein R8G60_15280 [Roseovarius pacificus]|nr:hypothetical protein [Roseovarius pacificus]